MLLTCSSAQKPLAGQLLFSESTAASAALITSPTSPPAMPLPNSKRFSHPPHLLKHKYIPTSVNRPTIASKDADTAMEEIQQEGHDNVLDSPAMPHKKRKKGNEELEGEKEKKGKKKRAQSDS